jgi:hypothetical protein
MSHQERIVKITDELSDMIQKICGEDTNIVFNHPVVITIDDEENQIEDKLWTSREHLATGIKNGYILYGKTLDGKEFEQHTDLTINALELAFILDKLEAKEYNILAEPE